MRHYFVRLCSLLVLVLFAFTSMANPVLSQDEEKKHLSSLIKTLDEMKSMTNKQWQKSLDQLKDDLRKKRRTDLIEEIESFEEYNKLVKNSHIIKKDKRFNKIADLNKEIMTLLQ